jgi:hypothetical protein
MHRVQKEQSTTTTATTTASINNKLSYCTTKIFSIMEQQQQQQEQEYSSSSSRLNILNQRREQMMQSINSTLQSEQMTQRRQQMRQGLQSIGSKLNSEQMTQHREQMRQGLQNVGSKLQQINLGKLINQMEQDQGLADQLESLNEHVRDEKERRDIRLEAEAACLQMIQDHLQELLIKYPNATYEQWIEDLHPENASEGQLLAGMSKEIDLRFYIEESDHRKLWNQHVTAPLRQVAARTRMWSDNQEPIDLLSAPMDDSPLIDTAQNTTTTTMTTTTTTPAIIDNQGGDLIQF